MMINPSSFGSPYVRAISPYVGGKPISELAREYGLDPEAIVKLASNENPLGASPKATAAAQAALSEIARYPDSNGYELKLALAHQYQVPMDWLTLGNGSNDILELVARSVVEAGQAVIYSQYGFAVYEIATQGVGGRHVVIPAQHYGHDLDAMAQAATDHSDSRLIYIANPNNPTGTFLLGAQIESFLARIPSHIVVVLDQAYDEYLDPQYQYDAVKMVRQYPNLLISRTFSKAYGLASLRIGFGIAQADITSLLNRVRQPFNVSSIAQAAALSALNDLDFIKKSYQMNREGYEQLTQYFIQNQIEFVPSQANFILFKAGSQKNAGALANEGLLKQGVIVRPVGSYGLPQWLRVTIGKPEENERFKQAFDRIRCD